MSLDTLYHHRNISVSLCSIDIQVEKHYSLTNSIRRVLTLPHHWYMDEQFYRNKIALYFTYLSFPYFIVGIRWLCTCYKSFPDHYTGENISSTIKEVLESYEIADCTVSNIVHDQGSNMRWATDLLRDGPEWTVQLTSCNFALVMVLKVMRVLIELLVLPVN